MAIFSEVERIRYRDGHSCQKR